MDLVKIRMKEHEGFPEADLCGFLVRNTFEEVIISPEDPFSSETVIPWKFIDKAEVCDVVRELKRPEE